MKRYRFFYYGLMVVMTLVGLYTGSRLCFLLVLVQLFTLLAAFFLNAWTLLSFAYVQELTAKEAVKGQGVTLHLGVTNDKPFPFTHMKIHVETPDKGEEQDLLIELQPRQQAVFDLPLTLSRRGEYRVGMTRVDIQDIFGLLPMHMDMRRLPYYRQRELLVLPRLLDVDLPAGVLWARRAGRGAAVSGGSEELSHLRAYAAGDPLSRVHWKASVKTRSMMTRQLEDPTGGDCLIFLDTRSTKEDPDAIYDRLTECALALTSAHLKRYGQVRVVSADENAEQPQPLYNAQALLPLRRWLALLPFDLQEEDSGGVCGQLTGWTGSLPAEAVYVLGAAYDEAVAQVLQGVDAVCYYLTALPLPEGVQATEGTVRTVSLYGQEVEAVLKRLLEEESL